MEDVHRRLARNVRALAEARELPLTHLADRAGVGRTQLWAVLSGRKSPTLGWLAKIADAMGVDVIDLLRSEPAEPGTR